jgi:hypothetical protein
MQGKLAHKLKGSATPSSLWFFYLGVIGTSLRLSSLVANSWLNTIDVISLYSTQPTELACVCSLLTKLVH